MTQPEPAPDSRLTVDEELRHLRIEVAGADHALAAACRKTDEQRQRADRVEAAVRAELDAIDQDRENVDCECEAEASAATIARIRAALDAHTNPKGPPT